MSRIFTPTRSPACWQELLADPDKHWKKEFSARTLAHSWEASNGLPLEIAAAFGDEVELLLAIPEHKTALPGGRRDSQSDVFALLRRADTTIAATIEGKVAEPFGPTVGEWLATPSDGKILRLGYICDLLGLSQPVDASVRYQLLHRTASAIIESERFKTDQAAMIVHSFSQTYDWFEDYVAFLELFNLKAERGQVQSHSLPGGKVLNLAWVCGDPAFLMA